MLQNVQRSVYELFVVYCAERGHEKYNWADCYNCACAQFIRDVLGQRVVYLSGDPEQLAVWRLFDTAAGSKKSFASLHRLITSRKFKDYVLERTTLVA